MAKPRRRRKVVMSEGVFNKIFRTLFFYSDPETYAAIGFFPDRPCGAFVEDFDDPKHPFLPGVRPGKMARKALRDLQEAARRGSLRDR